MKKTTNKTYQEVCGNEESIWFFVEPKDGKLFLQWAKDLGCRWLKGEEIKPKKGTNFFTISMHRDGKLAYVSYYCHGAPQFKNVKRVNFKDYKLDL